MANTLFSRNGITVLGRDRNGSFTEVQDTSPADSAVAITPSDTVNFSSACRAIYVGVTGDITAVVNGTAVLFKNCQAGSIIPIVATRVNATGTAATNLVALY